MGALDEMLSAWRNDPDAERTIALCSYLGVTQSEDLIREVGARAEAWHRDDGEVMLAVGRMYLDAELLTEAQGALVSAGKVNARDARPFRYLGEVLLRRGDALRSEKVLARALQLGNDDDDTELWHDRAVVYVALQKRTGTAAVAAEVARTLPNRNSIPSVDVSSVSYSGEEDPTKPGAALLPSPGPKQNSRIAGNPAAGRAPPRPPPPPPPRTPPPPPSRSNAAPSAFDMAGVGSNIRSPIVREPVQAQPVNFNDGLSAWQPASARVAPQRLAVPPLSLRTEPGGLHAPTGLGQRNAKPLVAPPLRAPAPAGFRTAAMPSFEDVTLVQEVFEDAPNPEPAIVLEHLARVGVFERGGGAAPAWERAMPAKTRGTWVLMLASALVVGVGSGAYVYAKKVKDERMTLAKKLGNEVETMLHTGSVADLKATDEKLSEAFELDSRSARAAKLWLQNRVLGALILPGEAHGIDSAVHRALSVGVPEEQVAFGRIAAFLVEGDLAGAAALLPKWDKKASKDAFYQLASGAALERAGDLRAIERYEAARALDPKLVISEVLLARLALLELGPDKGRPIIDSLKQKIGDVPTTKALGALLWAVQPNRGKTLPAGAEVAPEDIQRLPTPLRAVPHVIHALQAIDAGEPEKASKAIEEGISMPQSPATAAWLGFLAIQAGDEKLARKAALRALEHSAVYPRARVLAARVALLGGRLEEAKKAVEQLEPSAPEVAVVRAVVAYETIDTTELEGAVQVLGEAAKNRPDLVGLAAAPGVLSGSRYPDAEKIEEMARPQVPWGELVAVDAALDTGNLELANRIIEQWEDDVARPVYLLRLARLRRYQGKAEAAVNASRPALELGTTTARVLVERVFDLVAKQDAAGARDLVAKYPTLLGPMTAWLSALVDVLADRKAEANVKVAQLEVPTDAAPLLLRILAARSLAAAGDKRAHAYVTVLSRRYGKHPDVIKAIQDLQ